MLPLHVLDNLKLHLFLGLKLVSHRFYNIIKLCILLNAAYPKLLHCLSWEKKNKGYCKKKIHREAVARLVWLSLYKKLIPSLKYLLNIFNKNKNACNLMKHPAHQALPSFNTCCIYFIRLLRNFFSLNTS